MICMHRNYFTVLSLEVKPSALSLVRYIHFISDGCVYQCTPIIRISKYSYSSSNVSVLKTWVYYILIHQLLRSKLADILT